MFCYAYLPDYASYFHGEPLPFQREHLLINYVFIVVKGIIIGKTLHNNLFDKQNLMIRFDAVVDAVVRCGVHIATSY